jgi:hypothetical protein
MDPGLNNLRTSRVNLEFKRKRGDGELGLRGNDQLSNSGSHIKSSILQDERVLS